MRGATLNKLITTTSTLVENPLKFVRFSERFFTSFKVLGLYLEKTILPMNNLSSDHSYNQIPTHIELSNPHMWLGIFVFFVSTYGVYSIFNSKKEKNIILILASSYFIFFYLIISNLFFIIGTILAERLMYIPSIGFCLLTSWLIIYTHDKEVLAKSYKLFFNKKVSKKFMNHILYCSIALILTFYATISYKRNFNWRTEESLFLSAALRSPNSVLARSNAGAIHLINGDLVNARQELIFANTIYDSYNHAMNNLGLLYLREGNLLAARDQFHKTISKYPNYINAINNLAITYFYLEEFEKSKYYWTFIYNNNAEDHLIYYLTDKIVNLIKQNKLSEVENLYKNIKHIVNNEDWKAKIELILENFSKKK
ncbi:hypothetical protein ISS03_02075 [Patescibacteria group bacterium]|nr:hypothetical protein [Patescibacteria group bacterium]